MNTTRILFIQNVITEPIAIIITDGIPMNKILPILFPDGLNGIDIEVNKGEIVVLLGPSGSGKSTLLNIITFHYIIHYIL